MFIYQEEENKCEEFVNENDWYAYPWHSESGGVILPGKVVKYWLSLNIIDWYEVKDKKSIYESTIDIFTSEYKSVGLKFECISFDNYLIPEIVIAEEIIEKLLLSEIKRTNLHMIEATTIGYLRNKNITIQGILYGSVLHKQLNVFVCD